MHSKSQPEPHFKWWPLVFPLVLLAFQRQNIKIHFCKKKFSNVLFFLVCKHFHFSNEYILKDARQTPNQNLILNDDHLFFISSHWLFKHNKSDTFFIKWLLKDIFFSLSTFSFFELKFFCKMLSKYPTRTSF